MAIASSGIISGLDVTNLIKASMVYEKLPLERAEKRLTKTESQISAMGQIKSAIAGLQEAAKAISKSDDLYSSKASLSNADVATVTTSGKAAAGSYKIEIDQLATSHKLAGTIDTTSGGTLTIGLGSSTNSKTVNIAANASLSDVAKAINDADAGVSATVVNAVVNGQNSPQLVLTGKETGAANQITLSSSSIGTNDMVEKEAAQDAIVRIDGITLANTSSNTIKDALTGVDLTLKATTKGLTPNSTQLTVSSDNTALETKLKTFVDAYNKARSTMKDFSAYDATEKSAAVLNGDSAITNALNQLRGMLSTVPAGLDGNPYRSLAVLGVETSSAGVLSLNTTKLKSAMEADFTSVAQSVAAYGAAFDKLTTQMNGTDEKGQKGLIASRLDGLNSTTSRLKDNITTQERRVAQVQARYEKQFANLETLLSSMTTTSNYLTQQLASLSKLSG